MPLTEPVEAVSAVFVQGERIYAVERQPYLHAFPGYHSFPGGKIEANEDVHALNSSFCPTLDRFHLAALCREMDEEVGVDLQMACDSGIIESVEFLAMAEAPPFAPVRFRNWFYRIDLKDEVILKPDEGEFSWAEWKTPEECLTQFASGEALMVPPTRWMLEKLAEDIGCRNLGDLSEQIDERERIPEMMLLDGVKMLVVPSQTLPPAERTNAFRIGDAGTPQILVDPSPKSEKIYHVLMKTLASEKLDAVFLTHHHPDHHQFSAHFARERELPVMLSEDCNRRIRKKFGADYFRGLEIRTLNEGDEITCWHGEKVRVHPVPGHDAGQLALAPESLAWFLVGDLIQGIGTVVISAPEGDMANYFRTLDRVISLQPKVIIPSHGVPMKGTYRLEATLKHRRERESQVLELFRTGKKETEILKILYHDVDVRLHPYALKNIQSHLTKLRQEKRL